VVDTKEIFYRAQTKSWYWMKHRLQENQFTYSDWLSYPQHCLKTIA